VKELSPADLGVTLAPLVRAAGYEAPPGRKAGARVGSVEELVQKLHNEAKVI